MSALAARARPDTIPTSGGMSQVDASGGQGTLTALLVPPVDHNKVTLTPAGANRWEVTVLPGLDIGTTIDVMVHDSGTPIDSVIVTITIVA